MHVPINLVQYRYVCFQLKRRHVLASIVDSETSYLESLRRLVKDYERPLVDAKPQILSKNTIRVIFYKMNDILQVRCSVCEVFVVQEFAMKDPDVSDFVYSRFCEKCCREFVCFALLTIVLVCLQCHNMFHIELTESVHHWDERETIGHVFTASVRYQRQINYIILTYTEFICHSTRHTCILRNLVFAYISCFANAVFQSHGIRSLQ